MVSSNPVAHHLDGPPAEGRVLAGLGPVEVDSSSLLREGLVVLVLMIAADVPGSVGASVVMGVVVAVLELQISQKLLLGLLSLVEVESDVARLGWSLKPVVGSLVDQSAV